MIKKLFLSLVVLTCGAFGQAVRYDSIAQVLTARNLYTPVSNGTVVVYNYPGATTNCATAGTCTLATTYVDDVGVTSCGTSVPLTRPTSNSCTGSADAGANFGFWTKPGSYQYCVSGTGVVTTCTNITLSPPLYNINNILFVDGVRYTTIAQALAGVPASGASVIMVPSGYRETFTSHYDLGNGTTKAVILQLNNDVILTCNVTDASYCFTVHEASGIIGVRSENVNVDRSGGSVISIASTANVANVIKTGEDPQGSLTLSGFTVDNVNGGAISNAVVNLVNLNDSSTIRDIKASYFPHIGLHISTTTGGVKSVGPLNIDNCYFDGVSRVGARPLVIESDGAGATNNVNVMGGFYINAGSSLANIEINGGGNTQGALQQILISGVYTQQAAPSTAVTGIKIVDAAGVTIQTSSFQVTDTTTGHTGISINQSGSGRTHSINVQNFRLDSGGGNIGINNLITGTTVLNAVGTGNIPGYIYGGSAGTQTPSPFIFDDTQVTLAGGNVARTAATGTATVDLASVASAACTADSADVTLTGAVVGDPVRVSAATVLPAGVWLIGRVTASNTGRFQLCNSSGGAVDRASDTYTISVVK